MLKKPKLKNEYPKSGSGDQGEGLSPASNSMAAQHRRMVDRASDDDSIIAAGSTLKGEMSGKEGIRILGRMEGSPSSEGLVRIYEQGSVLGNIHAPYVILEGELKGNIISAKQVELRSPARMNGRIETQILAVAEGCILEGKVEMLKAEAQPIHFQEKRQPVPEKSGEGLDD